MKTLNLARLHNAEHLAFMSDVATLLQAVESTFFNELKQQFSGNVANEELANKEITKSTYTASLADLDSKRDRLYRGLVLRVQSETYSMDENKRQSAEKIMVVVDTYGNFVQHNYQKETTEIHNFINDLQSAEYTTAVEKIGLGQWIKWLEEVNTEFQTTYTSRRDEYASRKEYVLKNIRKESDERFKKIKEMATALTIVQPSEELNTFISKVNASIEKWNEVLAQRTKNPEKQVETE